MMHLDPGHLHNNTPTFKENARFMAHLAEVTSQRDMGPKRKRDLDLEGNYARDAWHAAKSNFIPDESKSWVVLCKRIDWVHGLYQLAGDEHLHEQQVSSWDPEWERMPFAGCVKGLRYEPLFGDHSPFRKDEFNPYRAVHFGMHLREHLFAFQSERFMQAVHAYFKEDDWMWKDNHYGAGFEPYIWMNYYDANEDLDWPFGFEGEDKVWDLMQPRWYAEGGRPLTWCTHSNGMWCEENSTSQYAFSELGTVDFENRP